MSVETSRHNHVLVVKMVRPEKRNALNKAMTAGMDAALNELEDNPQLWCGILTGTESVFSAGADLSEGPGEPTRTRRHSRRYYPKADQTADSCR